MKVKVDTQLDKMVEQGVLIPVQYSDYASPIVSVLKKDGTVRICADYKQTVSTIRSTDSYPIPNIHELYSKLARGCKYTQLDLSQAYAQIMLHPDSPKFTTINTTKGLFMYTRLPYGINCALGIFQRIIEQVLQGIPGTAVYLDDVVCTGVDELSHRNNMKLLLDRLQSVGLRLKREKCEFMKDSIVFLGNRLDAKGVRPTASKIDPIANAQAPQNVSEL